MTPERLWIHDVSDEPKLVPPGWRLLGSCVRIDSGDGLSGTWVGAGFVIADLLARLTGDEDEDDEPEPAHQCAACGSHDTLCVYLRMVRHAWGGEIDVEVECRDCGRFTHHHTFD